MQHYYTKDPQGEYKEHQITCVIMGQKIMLTTADGVFSKSNVDYGTMMLLKALFAHHEKIGSLLDIGCGYGVIGISAALITGADVTMADINQRAVSLAENNAKANNAKADIIASDGYTQIDGTFDIIITNPPIRAGKKAYYPWIENAKDYLNEGGELWLVVQKKQGASSIKKLMQETFCNCETIKKDAGYYILVSRRKDDSDI